MSSSIEVGGETKISVLYELLIHSEWTLDNKDLVKQSVGLAASSTPSTWSVIHRLGSPLRSVIGLSLPTGLVSLINNQLSWKFTVSNKRRLIAVLQESSIEIRTAKDDYTNPLAKWHVARDLHPQWRQLMWSPDGSLLAYAESTGIVHVYDLSGTELFNVNEYEGDVALLDWSYAIAGIFFVACKHEDKKWIWEILVVSYKGQLTGYRLSEDGQFEKSCACNFAGVYPRGIGALAYDSQHSMLVLGGCAIEGNHPGIPESEKWGVSRWRVLSTFPRVKLITSEDDDNTGSSGVQSISLLRKIMSVQLLRREQDCVYRMSFSPGCSMLVTLHYSGRLSLWQVPSLRLINTWSLEEQPNYDARKSHLMEQFGKTHKPKTCDDPASFLPIDVNWWSEEALILARANGAVTVLSCNDLENLLGQSCEWFEPAPQISVYIDGQFTALECECSVPVKKRRQTSTDDSETTQNHDHSSLDDDYDREESSMMGSTAGYVKNILYYMTDSEKFRLPRQRPKLMNKTYRLISLKSTTPEQLYKRKIASEEYGEALELAKAYNLDCDLVYQKQWRASNASVTDIQDYLAKITKRSWVLHECLERVPADIDAAHELLQYGLRGTGVEALIAVGTGEDSRFILSNNDDDDDDNYIDYEEVPERKRRFTNEDLLCQIDFESLSLMQIELCRTRIKLLKYLDSLAIYEILLGGPHAAEEKFDHKHFQEFRQKTIVEATLEFARLGDVQAMKTMLTFHGDELLLHWLPILCNLPETLPPEEYAMLLPSVTEDGNLSSWEHETLRAKDWCEMESCWKVISMNDADSAPFLYEEDPQLLEYRIESTKKKGDLLSEWYCFRAKQIEQRSSLVDNARQLLHLGMEKKVQNLLVLHDDLLLVEKFVYECEIESLTLQQYLDMTNDERLALLMSKSSEEDYTRNLYNWMVPFLTHCEKRAPSSSQKLLNDYLISMARTDLTYCAKVFQNSKPEVEDPVVSDTDLLMKLALECLYTCERSDQLLLAAHIFECLPERNHGLVSGQSIGLHCQVDALQEHLRGAEILEKNGLPVRLNYIQTSQNDREETEQLFVKLTRIAGHRSPGLTEFEWKQLLYSLLELQRRVYRCITVDECYKIFIDGLLCSGIMDNLRLAGEMITTASSDSDAVFKKISYETSVSLVVNAAREYFDAAVGFADPSMELSRACLNLVTDKNDDICRELNLIASLVALNNFGITTLPVQVRLHKDRLAFIRKILQSDAKLYKTHSGQLMKLADLLMPADQDETEWTGRVLVMLAESALLQSDFPFCCYFCEHIIDRLYTPGWQICEQLGEHKDYSDITARSYMISYALVYCTSDRLESLLKTKATLQRDVIAMSIGYAKSRDHGGDIIRSKDENADSAIESSFHDTLRAEGELAGNEEIFVIEDKIRKETAESEKPPGDSAGNLQGNLARSAISQTRELTKNVLLSTTETTKHVLSSTTQTTMFVLHKMSDMNWWRQVPRALSKTVDSQPQWNYNSELDQIMCHPFYSSVIPGAMDSQVFGDYELCEKPTFDPIVKFTLLQLRAAKLEEMVNHYRNLGEEAQAVADVLLKLVASIMPHDIILGTSYLLALSQYLDAEQYFATLPSSALPLQVAAYYYGLIVSSDRQMGRDLYLCSPKFIINKALSAESDISESDAEGVEKLKKYCKLLDDFAQGKTLQALGMGIDVSRFTHDVDYQQETIIGLIMTLDDDVYKLAMSLADKYNVPLWDMFVTHLEFLFMESGLSTEELESRVTELGILQTLNSKPSDLHDHLVANVYPTINGLDHTRLLYYYTLLENCKGLEMENVTKPSTHIKLLKKLKSIAPGLNYKNLMATSYDPLDVVEAGLTASNVHALAKLASKLPVTDCSIDASAVYSRWASKNFWQLGDQVTTEITQSNWIEQYDLNKEFLQRLKATDFLSFAGRVVFTKSATQKLSFATRQELMNRVVDYARDKQRSRRSSSHDWDLCVEELNKWNQHLNTCITNKFISSLRDSESQDLRDYALEFDISRGEEEAVKNLLYKVLEDGYSLEIIDSILSLSLHDSLKLTDIVYAAVLRIIDKIRVSSNLNVSINMEQLARICSTVKLSDTMPQHEVLSLLLPLCADVTIIPDRRLGIINLIEKVFTLEKSEAESMILYKTQAIVTASWPDYMISDEDVDGEPARLELLNKLLTESRSLEQLSTVAQLLFNWPKFSKKCILEHHPWRRVLVAMLQWEEADAPNMVVSYVQQLEDAKSPLDRQLCEMLYEILWSDEAYMQAVKLSLSTKKHKELHLRAIQDLMTMTTDKSLNFEDEEFLRLLLEDKLVPASFNSPFYVPLVNFILANHMPGDEVYDVEMIVQHLASSGHEVQANALLQRHRGQGKVRGTIDAGMNVLRRWWHK